MTELFFLDELSL